MKKKFLELNGITKSFDGVHALHGVDIVINSGEVHCIAGENGSGKSTLIKIISGVYTPTSGEITIEDRKYAHLTPIESINLGIQVIYQDFALFPNLTVAENISMNQIVMTGAKFMNWKKSRAIAVEAMDKIGAAINPDLLVEQLSIGNRQMVAICRAIINEAKLLILDEPTASLTKKEVELLNDILRNLRDKGMAIVIVNHKVDEIFEIAERITIIRNGEKVSTGMIEEYDRQRFTKDLTGRQLDEIGYLPEESNGTVFQVEKISRKGAFEDISFTLKKGDVLGITGLLGSGRGQVGDALFGLAPIDSGKIFLNGKEIRIQSVDDAIANRIAYVPEDRLTQGLFLDRSIQDNTSAASLKKYHINGKIDNDAMYRSTEEWIKKIGCVAPSPKVPVRTLSGGNAQKIVIAKWLNTDPSLIILNGPTIGVDIGAKFDIHRILHDLASTGIGVIIISDDLSELIINCSSILVMKDGKMSHLISAGEVNETQLSAMLKES